MFLNKMTLVSLLDTYELEAAKGKDLNRLKECREEIFRRFEEFEEHKTKVAKLFVFVEDKVNLFSFRSNAYGIGKRDAFKAVENEFEKLKL